MRVVLVSDHETHGGAGQSASRLAEALCEAHDVTRVVRFPDGGRHPWRSVVLGEELAVTRQLLRVPRKLAPSQFPRPGTPAYVARQLRRVLRRLRPDVINVHNLHGASPWGWGVGLVAECARHAPVVWTLHDQWSFTGRCAYAYDCTRFRTGCDAACPTPHEPPSLRSDAIADAWDERRRLFVGHANLTAVTPSGWLAAQAASGLWSGHRIDVIPYGVPLDVFHPAKREEARRALGITARGPVLLLAAVDLAERRKGAELLPRLWGSIAARPLTLLTMGRGELLLDEAGVFVHRLGWVEDEPTKVLAFNAADVVLHPAPVDNFPNVLLEAFACGTPAVGLPVGGVPELIRPGVSGWLAAAMSAEGLARAVDRALTDVRGGIDLRASSRRLAETEFPPRLQAERYMRLFHQLRNAARPATMKVIPAVPVP